MQCGLMLTARGSGVVLDRRPLAVEGIVGGAVQRAAARGLTAAELAQDRRAQLAGDETGGEHCCGYREWFNGGSSGDGRGCWVCGLEVRLEGLGGHVISSGAAVTSPRIG